VRVASDASPSSASSNTRFVEGLDHIRAIAALLVVFHHSYWQAAAVRSPILVLAPWPKTDSILFAPLLETHFTMAIFFVLSGFLLTLCTFRRRMHFAGYLRNRSLRVLPVLLTILLLGVAIFPDKFTLSAFVASATIFGNVQDAALQMDPITTVLWTVAVEFQFYLVLPLLVVILARQGTRPFLFMIALMLVLRFLGFFLLHDPEEHDIFAMNYWFFVPGRFDQFLIGMLSARFYLQWQDDPRSRHIGAAGWLSRRGAQLLDRFPGPALGLASAAIFLWTYALNRLGGAPVHALWKFAWPTGEALLCAALMLSYAAVVGRVPRMLRRVLTLIGSMSFSIYVVHFMLVWILVGDLGHLDLLPGHMVDFVGLWGVTIWGNATLNTLLLVMPIVLAVSYLLHVAVELPFMRLRGRYTEDFDSKEPTA
jgi:peptidoglycan/LPS O-acetylase OafA/YrhL